MDNKRQGIMSLATNPAESPGSYRELYMAELKKANKDQHARQVAQEKYHAHLHALHALQEEIELESRFPHCRYCGRRLPKKSHRREDLICVFCLKELNDLRKTRKSEIEVGVNRYLPQSNAFPKTHYLEDKKTEKYRKNPLDWQSQIEGGGGGWFVIYADTR